MRERVAASIATARARKGASGHGRHGHGGDQALRPVDGQEAVCFAALVKKEKGTDKHGNPFVKCHFRDKRTSQSRRSGRRNALRERGGDLGRRDRLPAPGQGATGSPSTACSSRSSRSARPSPRTPPTATTSSTSSRAAEVQTPSPAQVDPRRIEQLHRRPAPEAAGPRDPRGARRALQEDARRPELPPQLHGRPARARLEHDAGRQLPGRPLRQRTTTSSTPR